MFPDVNCLQQYLSAELSKASVGNDSQGAVYKTYVRYFMLLVATQHGMLLHHGSGLAGSLWSTMQLNSALIRTAGDRNSTIVS
jgi:hypothetical protein